MLVIYNIENKIIFYHSRVVRVLVEWKILLYSKIIKIRDLHARENAAWFFVISLVICNREKNKGNGGEIKKYHIYIDKKINKMSIYTYKLGIP